MWSVITESAYLIPHLHICSDWLITKKSNIQSSVWTTLMKLGMWVVMGTNTTQVVCLHQMHISNTSFAFLFWLAYNKNKNKQKKNKYPEFCMGYIDETWYVGSDGHKTTHVVCRHQMRLLKVDIPILTCIFFTFNWLTLTSEMHFVKFHPKVASCLLSRCKRKYPPLGMRLLWKYIRNYFLVYHSISHFFVKSPKLQRIWSWNFGFAIRKIWAFIWYQKTYYFRLSPGGWECDRHKVL